jgi:hypothetical protein
VPQLAHLSTVGIHRVLLVVAGLVDLVNDDLGVIIGIESLFPRETAMRSPWIRALYSAPFVRRLGVDL